jgi:hypothetical protein
VPFAEATDMSKRSLMRLAAFAALILVPSVALGYGILVHNLIVTKGLADEKSLANTPVKSTTLTGVRVADIDRFRLWFYAQARALPDTAARTAFARRYPTAAAFDARAFKGFLMMNEGASVLGVDSFPAVYRARTPVDARQDPYPQYNEGNSLPLMNALAMGTLYVDLDRRNQDRLFRGPDGKPRLTANGDTVPFDPMTLNMGRLTGPTSQAHAHYGLNHMPKSSDPAVMRSSPYNYVVAIGFPGPVETYAEQNAQIYTDLSLLALLEGGSGMQTLSSIYAGSAFHYIEDVANAVHTLQGGTPGIQNDITLARLLRQMKAGFGLWGKVPTKLELSLDILANLHTLSEKLFQVELSEALMMAAQNNTAAIPESMRNAPTALARGDTAIHVNYHALVNNAMRDSKYPEFGRLLAGGVVDNSYEDGAEILRLTRAMANNTVRRATQVIDFDTIPDSRVWEYIASRTSSNTQNALRRFNGLQIKGIQRANEAVQAWWYAYGLLANPAASKKTEARNAIVGRLVSQQLAYLSAAEARRTTWLGTHGGLR